MVAVSSGGMYNPRLTLTLILTLTVTLTLTLTLRAVTSPALVGVRLS